VNVLLLDYESCAVSVQAGNQSSTLKPVILPEVMKSHRQQICELISCEKRHPQDHAKFFDKYADLISRQVWLLDDFSLAYILPLFSLSNYYEPSSSEDVTFLMIEYIRSLFSQYRQPSINTQLQRSQITTDYMEREQRKCNTQTEHDYVQLNVCLYVIICGIWLWKHVIHILWHNRHQ